MNCSRCGRTLGTGGELSCCGSLSTRWQPTDATISGYRDTIARLTRERDDLKQRLATRIDLHDSDGRALLRLTRERDGAAASAAILQMGVDRLAAELDGTRDEVERLTRERDEARAEVERLTGLLALSQEHFNEALEASETNARRVLDLAAERDEARSEAEYLRRVGRAYQETALARAASDVRAAEAQHKDLATWVGALMEAPESSWRGMIRGGYAHETVGDVRLLIASARKLSSEFSVWTQRGGAPPFRLIESVRDLRHALCALLDEGQQPKEEG